VSESQTDRVDDGKSYRRAVIIGLVLNISASLIGISYAAGIIETQVSNESHDLNEQQLRLHELAHEEHRLRQNIWYKILSLPCISPRPAHGRLHPDKEPRWRA
jgi:hypothetical protein